ncbi:NirD/YgiW/YdeI family stress tolerance protein [Alkanindiges sp. WGS2144]|uniref:NirD/YgiW/YdeI family stress tolerance protein n=1 Tax=Alkanindiges sp. WGS2144 TaxID=3366808 RepID=UPI00375167A4
MRAIIFAGCITVGCFGSIAQAQPVNQAALNATQGANVTVAQAKTLKDDSKVILRGQVVRALGNEKYEFKDATGTIVVDIDDEKWRGQPVSSKATVTLVGEVDHDRFPKESIEIEVDEIRF